MFSGYPDIRSADAAEAPGALKMLNSPYGHAPQWEMTIEESSKDPDRKCQNVAIGDSVDPSNLIFHKSLGIGGQAEVFLTTWRRLCGQEIVEETVAVKKMEAGVKSSKREALLLQTDHPNIVRCLGASESGSKYLIVMDYCAGGSLYDRLYTPRATPLSWVQRVKVLCDIAEGMAYLHGQSPKIIHRDLKSTNVLLEHRVSDEDKEPVAKITDFGVAVTAEEEALAKNQMTQCVGTWRWTAPEVFRTSNYDEKVDVYSFAMVIYELITSKLPYSDKWPDSSAGMSAKAVLSICDGLRPIIKKSQFKGCPVFLRDLMLKCWDSDPSVRPSFLEVAAKLQDKLVALKVKAEERRHACDQDGSVSERSVSDGDRSCGNTSGHDFEVPEQMEFRGAPSPPMTTPDLRPPPPPATNADPPKMKIPMTAPGGLHRFLPGNKPPTPPQSKNFRYEGTTVFIETDQPHEIGNTVLDYLSSEFDACVTKVTPTKCSFKTEIRVEGSVACTMKVRIHSKTAGFDDSCHSVQMRQYAVRFQRRSGCAFVFHNTYESIQKFLATRFTVVESGLPENQLENNDAAWLNDMDRSPRSPAGQPFLKTALSDIPDLPDMETSYFEAQEMDLDDLDLPPMPSLMRS